LTNSRTHGRNLKEGKPLRYLTLVLILIALLASTSEAQATKRDPVVKAKQTARTLLARRGWASQYWALHGIIMRESSWNVRAYNHSSGACGIPQALPCSKMASMGSNYRTSALTQLRWMLRYIGKRYGSPVNAYYYRVSRGYY
jgi:hypothetical protein